MRPPVYVTVSDWRSTEPGAITIDYKSATISRDGQSYGGRITRGFRILTALVSAADGLLSYDEMFHSVWGDDPDGGPLERLQVVVKLRLFSLQIKLRNGSVPVTQWLGFHPYFNTNMRMIDVGWGMSPRAWYDLRRAT